ncbi:MAG: serine hydrolase [Spirochaetes bacterium]|nr:serine hydrolase [Spirochaetota bacterium]
MNEIPNSDPRFEELAACVKTGMRRLGVPGASLGVWSGGRQMVAAFGRTSVENPLPVTPETYFQIGSITKTMTTAALLRLAELGKVDMDAPVAKQLPGFSMADPDVTARLTSIHLVTHTGGWVGDYFDDFGSGDDALARMVAAVGRLPQVTPLGAFFSYNNSGFNIAGRLVEVASGKPYEEALADLILKPAGMTRTRFYPDDVLITYRFVSGHEKKGGRTVVSRPWAIGRAGNCVGGGVCAVGDLLRWARVMMGQGESPEGVRVLAPGTIAEMLEPLIPAGFGRRMALTWNLREPGGIRFYGHGGATHGQQAALHFAPGKNFAVALLTNSQSGTVLTDNLLAWAARLWFDVEAEQPEPIARPKPVNLTEFTGRYDLPISAFKLVPRKGGFTVIDIPRGGFPRSDSPAGDPTPPLRALLCEGDRFLVLDEPSKGSVGEFLRDASGRVAWCRFGGRVHVKK